MFEKYRKFETTFAGRPLVVETGKTCELSNGSCWVRYGETVVMANVTASAKPREGVDFFPLSVDYEERMYAVGRIPGSFTKREGKPSEKAILTSRMVDRPIRPLFPKDMRNDVSVVMTVLAVDPDCSPEITGMLATSIAISISDIPWNGPIAGISVGLVDGEIVLNPTLEQRAHNDLRLTVAGTMEKIVMIEAGANEIPEQQMLDAILAGHAEIKKMVAFINDIKSEIGKPKFEFQSMELDHDLFAAIEAMVGEQVKVALDTNDKNERDARMQPIIDAVHEKYDPEYPEQGAMLDECLYKLQKKIVRNWLYEGKRVDGRGIDEIRAGWCRSPRTGGWPSRCCRGCAVSSSTGAVLRFRWLRPSPPKASHPLRKSGCRAHRSPARPARNSTCDSRIRTFSRLWFRDWLDSVCSGGCVLPRSS